MEAVILHGNQLRLEKIPEPVPAPGQLLTRPLSCGVCGSDLHARDHADHLCALLNRAGFRGFMNPDRPVVMGHEFCCEILESSAGFTAGERVVALPFLTSHSGITLLGYSNDYPGAFAEQMLLQADLTIAVPDHVPTDIAALTEPLSVAVHAVAEASANSDCAFTVVGCGPVGLFVIARLRALGLGPILAIEPNPARRKMAEAMGADIVVSPETFDSSAWWADQGLHIGLSDAMAHAADAKKRTRAILFECVGKPGMLMSLARAAPVGATIVVVGNCMEPDTIEPAFLLQKSLSLRFVFAYSASEFRDAFDMICAAPKILAPLVSETVPLARVNEAFDALAGGAERIKILVAP